MAIAILVLMPVAFSDPLLRIYLLGSHTDANVLQGIWQMARQGDIVTASVVAFCIIGAPVTLVVAIAWLFLGKIFGINLRPILLMLSKLKEWVKLDIYLVGIAVACIKVREYAFIQPVPGLIAFIALVILSLLTLIHLNMEQLWERFYPLCPPHNYKPYLRVCLGCHFTSLPDSRGRCLRCHLPLLKRRKQSLQKSWAALIAAIIFLLPANLLPISIIYLNGTRQTDTIMSGIIALSDSNIAVAAVVFIASILVPIAKIFVLLALLCSIHFKWGRGLKTRIQLLRLVNWIGRWSMLDLFVISLMMSLVNRDQLLAFTIGPAAMYFGTAVILTILSVEWLDSRLLWDAHESGYKRVTDRSAN